MKGEINKKLLEVVEDHNGNHKEEISLKNKIWKLAAYALVFTVLLRFANSILLGMTSGLGTLCGQAYGARRYHMLGIYLEQSWIILIITSTILSPIFIFATPILKALGQDELIAEVAGSIALWFIPVISYRLVAKCTYRHKART
ncbi:hypothetical protein BUALT_Bualt16G0106900 [Buddleja alternifolia]|uniref:Uncharacterized protein n=1 Tax=Buddleja alternifolia TaxID=168488 RepID=A0AAV6W8K0_9LAMI|nr:hypothetical protein BUALT_Bualt16G0106900 [Buddleja alternifolia]